MEMMMETPTELIIAQAQLDMLTSAISFGLFFAFCAWFFYTIIKIERSLNRAEKNLDDMKRILDS